MSSILLNRFSTSDMVWGDRLIFVSCTCAYYYGISRLKFKAPTLVYSITRLIGFVKDKLTMNWYNSSHRFRIQYTSLNRLLKGKDRLGDKIQVIDVAFFWCVSYWRHFCCNSFLFRKWNKSVGLPTALKNKIAPIKTEFKTLEEEIDIFSQ